jgi:hypothetical protein
MSRSEGQSRGEYSDPRGGVWDYVAWTWPARARVLLALIVLVSAVSLRLASYTLGSDLKRSYRLMPVLVVDPNTAPDWVLEALPRVGPSLVKQLIEQRERRPFVSTEDLRRRVRGLGPATLARLTPHLRITASSAPIIDSKFSISLSPSNQTELAQAPRHPVSSR